MMKKTLIASAIVSLFVSTAVIANDESQELRDIIKQQQEVLKTLEQRLDQTEQRLEATADQIEMTNTSNIFSSTSIGGYGELHYNNYEDQDAKIDFHRFVLFFGYEFSDDIHFFSEFELEHSIAGDGQAGEVELEQAFVEININEKTSSKVGLF